MLMPMLWKNDLDEIMDPFDMWDRKADRFFGNDLMEFDTMKTDVIEEDNDYKLKADLPGFDKKDIGIDLKGGVLTISANHKENKDEKDSKGKYVRKERREMSYHRSFTVGDNMKPEDINAAYENGVLTIILPKKELEQKNDNAMRIEVK